MVKGIVRRLNLSDTMLDALKNEVFLLLMQMMKNSVERARRVLFPFYHGWSDYDAIPSEEFEYGGKHYFRTYSLFEVHWVQGDDNGVVQNLYLNKNTDWCKNSPSTTQASNNVHLAPKRIFDSFETRRRFTQQTRGHSRRFCCLTAPCCADGNKK